MKENQQQFYVVPGSVLEKILDGQSKILDILNGDASSIGKSSLGDYITEADAKKLLGRSTGWFHKMRKTGLLPSSKVGGKQYYRKQDIQKLFDSVFSGTLKNKTFQNAKS
ncbi:MAG: helix-turn-helix domain-containing protein [Bacteroidetes bacterium]|nr:helix-turn-helix domain-containing protein [Bacteroidota bacterium]